MDIGTQCDDAAFLTDGKITLISQNIGYEEFSGVATAGETALEPLFSAEGVVTGKNLRGRFIVSQDTPLAKGQFMDLATVTAPTGGAANKFSGVVTFSFVGNIA